MLYIKTLFVILKASSVLNPIGTLESFFRIIPVGQYQSDTKHTKTQCLDIRLAQDTDQNVHLHTTPDAASGQRGPLLAAGLSCL
jgi:hypothetical protein